MGKSTSLCISGQNDTRDLNKNKQTKNQTQTHTQNKKELKGKKPHKSLNKDVKHLTDFRGHVV